ncbi:4Fe-4S binding protein [bacterium]|nr:4Fe-4S binding protein [bacterium]
MQYCFLFDGRRCTGCKTCVLACKDYHDLPSGIAYRQVFECEAGSWARDEGGAWSTDGVCYYLSVSCNHCQRPVCVHVCPTGAMHRDDDGFVKVNARRCIGCGYCAMSCPYRAPHVDRTLGHSVKCDGCASRVAGGERPVCVEACPQRALDLAPVEEVVGTWGAGDAVPPMPDRELTGPNLVVIAPTCIEQADGDLLGQVRVTNERELV